MKSEPFRFSPTSVGVRIEHLNLKNSNNTNSRPTNTTTDANNNCNTGILQGSRDFENKKTTTFSLPRARAQNNSNSFKKTSTLQRSGERDSTRRQFCNQSIAADLEQVIVHNGKSLGKNRNLHEKTEEGRKSNKMRNCCIVTGVVVIISLLSLVLLVECRSVIKGSTSNTSTRYQQDEEISSESRIQDTSVQEPDPESSEEYPTKVVSTTASANKGSSSTATSASSFFPSKASTTQRSNGRLTRSRVSVVCKGGYIGGSSVEGSPKPNFSTSTSTSTSKSSSRKVNLPIILPRASDDDDEEEYRGSKRQSWNDDNDDDQNSSSLNSEETQQHIVTLTGYSQVTSGPPETTHLKRSGSSTKIKYIPKPSPTEETTTNDEYESNENVETDPIKFKRRPNSSRTSRNDGVERKSKNHRLSSSSVERKGGTTLYVAKSLSSSERSNLKSEKSRKRNKQDGKSRNRQPKRQSSEEEEENDGGEESVEVSTTSRPKHHRSSKKSSKNKQSTSTSTTAKNQKGDSDEFEEDSLFPTLRPSERKQITRKSSERRKPPKDLPIPNQAPDSEQESAEAEPAALEVRSKPEIVTSSSTANKKSSKSRKEEGSKGPSRSRETLSPKSITTKKEFSSEEYNFEETPWEDQKKSKSRRSSSSSSSSRNSRMNSRTSQPPKMRMRMFTSLEEDD